MKIHFTKNEYRLLIEMLSMSEWVMHSHEIEYDDACNKHDQLIQKILSYHKDFQCDDIIQHDKQNGKYYQTIFEDDESPVNDLIKEYETEVFWEELCDRLAQRDLIEKHAKHEISEMDTMEKMEKTSEISQKYYDEFADYGVQRLKIDKSKA